MQALVDAVPATRRVADARHQHRGPGERAGELGDERDRAAQAALHDVRPVRRREGAAGGVVNVTDEGLTTESLLALDQAGGDATLYRLLSADTAATKDLPVPEGALGFSATAVDFSGLYDYLNELALAVPELGGDLDNLVLSFTGLNLRESVFSWTGEQFVTVTTGLGETTEPGVPSENLLGDAAYLIEATNAAAAQRGLGALLQNIAQVAGSLSDPQGGAGETGRSEETVAGVNVTRFDFAPGASIFTRRV